MAIFKHRIVKATILSVAILVLISWWFLYLDAHEDDYPPNLFPFGDTQATYIIKHDPANNQYNIIYDTMKDREKLGTCDEPDGGIARCYVEGDFHIDIPIASSPVDLDEFVDQQVKITGEFVFAQEQCIKEACTSLGSKRASLQLTSISHEKTQ